MSKDIRFIVLIIMQVLVIIGLAVVIGMNDGSKEVSSASIHRQTANKLHAAGVIEEAILQYEKYLEQGAVDGETRAKIAFSLGPTLFHQFTYTRR